MLADELKRLWDDWRVQADPNDLRILEAAFARVDMLQIPAHGLQADDFLPDFALPDCEERIIRSDDLLAAGPLVVTFFRGGWCPYCDAAMRALEKVRPAIEATGSGIVGILPEKAQQLSRTIAEKGLGYLLLSDVDGNYARMCGLEFELTEDHREFYRRFGVDIALNNAGAGWALPLPATYLVDQAGLVRWAFVDHDYKKRAEPDMVLATVRHLAQAS